MPGICEGEAVLLVGDHGLMPTLRLDAGLGFVGRDHQQTVVHPAVGSDAGQTVKLRAVILFRD
ncbi:hypothetical protein D9M68_727200 [compost metagenome]